MKIDFSQQYQPVSVMNKPVGLQNALKQDDMLAIFFIFEKIPINFRKNNTQKRQKMKQKKCCLAKIFGCSD